MIKTILFDLDGTLLNSIDDITDSLNHVLRKKGYKEQTTERVKTLLGHGSHQLIKSMGVDDKDLEEMYRSYLDKYSQNLVKRSRLYLGLFDILKALKEKGYKLGIVTNKDNSFVKYIERILMPGIFDFTIGSTNEEERKPSPVMIDMAIKYLGANKTETVYVGDSEVDAETARNAGIRSIGVAWGYRPMDLLERSGFDYLITNPEMLLSIVGYR